MSRISQYCHVHRIIFTVNLFEVEWLLPLVTYSYYRHFELIVLQFYYVYQRQRLLEGEFDLSLLKLIQAK